MAKVYLVQELGQVGTNEANTAFEPYNRTFLIGANSAEEARKYVEEGWETTSCPDGGPPSDLKVKEASYEDLIAFIHREMRDGVVDEDPQTAKPPYKNFAVTGYHYAPDGTFMW